MTDGWVKVAAATPHIKVADCEYNVRELLRIAECAAEEGTEIGVPGAVHYRIYLPGFILSANTAAGGKNKH